MKKSMRNKVFLKEICTLLFGVTLVLTSVTVAAEKASIKSITYDKPYLYYRVGDRQEIFWDNNMSFTGLIRAQYDSVVPLDCYPADDFQFSINTYIKDVHWIGGYWFGDYQQGDFDWSILFYLDRGDGNAPGDVFAGPFNFTSSEITKTFIWDTGSFNFYELSVDLPNYVKFSADKKYWISIWGIGLQYPCSGWGFHFEPIILHKGLVKSFYFLNDTEWHDIEDLGEMVKDPTDLCFQLTGIIDEPPEKPTIDGPIKGKVGKNYPYSFTSIDLDGDQVSYYIDWGDGTTINWTPLQASGVPYLENHAWTTKGTYTIKCKSKDSHGMESDWGRLEVSMPRIISSKSLFIKFFEQFPHAFPILRHLIGL